MKDRIAKWYRQGLWDEAKVRNAVLKEIISKEDYREITGEDYV